MSAQTTTRACTAVSAKTRPPAVRQFALARTVASRGRVSNIRDMLVENSPQTLVKPARSIWTAVLRGLRSRCPNCGRGRLFRSYLKPVENCRECCENLGRIRADDGPAWLTVLITGHVTVGAALTTEMVHPIPVAASIAIFSGLTLAMALALLPRAKGVFIGAIWAMHATGED